jgi:hypothetical protein
VLLFSAHVAGDEEAPRAVAVTRDRLSAETPSATSAREIARVESATRAVAIAEEGIADCD